MKINIKSYDFGIKQQVPVFKDIKTTVNGKPSVWRVNLNRKLRYDGKEFAPVVVKGLSTEAYDGLKGDY